MAAVWLVLTVPAETGKVAAAAPPAMVTPEGTVSKPVLEDSVAVNAPGSA